MRRLLLLTCLAGAVGCNCGAPERALRVVVTIDPGQRATCVALEVSDGTAIQITQDIAVRAGRGTLVTDPCPTCHGRGLEPKRREVKVRLPAGVKDRQRIRLKGRGGSGRNGGPAGDLYVVAHVAADALFGRDGNNLTLTVPVTYPEAALGTKVKVPTLDGPPVTLKLPAGTSSGRVFRVKGKGVGAAKSTGDLLVTIEVAVPSQLSDDERAAVEALAETITVSPRDFLGV